MGQVNALCPRNWHFSAVGNIKSFFVVHQGLVNVMIFISWYNIDEMYTKACAKSKY